VLTISRFPTGSYRAAIAAYQELSSPSPLLSLYAARAHLALTPPAIQPALSLLSSLPQTLDTRAVIALAHYLQGETESAVGDLEELLADLGDQGLEEAEETEGRFVRGVIGTVWVLEGEERREEGIEILREAVELGKDQEWCVQALLCVEAACGVS
jgi:coatomer protein complex subunit epsilon